MIFHSIYIVGILTYIYIISDTHSFSAMYRYDIWLVCCIKLWYIGIEILPAGGIGDGPVTVLLGNGYYLYSSIWDMVFPTMMVISVSYFSFYNRYLLVEIGFNNFIVTRDGSLTKLFSTIKVVRLLWIGIWVLLWEQIVDLLVLFLLYVSGRKGTFYNHSRNNDLGLGVSLRELLLQFFSLSYSLLVFILTWEHIPDMIN